MEQDKTQLTPEEMAVKILRNAATALAKDFYGLVPQPLEIFISKKLAENILTQALQVIIKDELFALLRPLDIKIATTFAHELEAAENDNQLFDMIGAVHEKFLGTLPEILRDEWK